MKANSAFLRHAALLSALALCVPSSARARNYLVCYLPPDPQKHLIRFCPGAPDSAAGEPCQCQLQAATLTGAMTVLAIPAPDAQEAPSTVCMPGAHAAAVTLCTAFRPAGGGGCECGGEAGEAYAISMIPRVPLRTNQSAAADFLRRLQECCLAK